MWTVLKLSADSRMCCCPAAACDLYVRRISTWRIHDFEQEGQHPMTGQRAANFRLLANQLAERRLVTQ